MNFTSVLAHSFFGNSIKEYFVAIVIFFIIFVGLKLFKKVFIVRLRKIATKTKTDVDDLIVDMLEAIGNLFFFFVALYFASLSLSLPQVLKNSINEIIVIVVTVYTILAIQRIVDYAVNKYIKKASVKDSRVNSIKLLAKFGKVTIWIIAVILILSNLGYNVSTLIAGLGIGGVAVAFALQNILSDIFSSFSIHFDKPFEVGDFITVGNDSGTVKKIGIKSTRLEVLQGEELVISNKELTEKRIHNYKKMKKRRVVFSVGITYDTGAKQLRKVPDLIRKIFDEVDKVTLDRVNFKEFGDSELSFEIVYYINSDNYSVYMDTQQEINFRIYEEFAKHKLSMAYPTQTIYLKK